MRNDDEEWYMLRIQIIWTHRVSEATFMDHHSRAAWKGSEGQS